MLRDPHKAVSSIITVTILCLIVISAPQADETETGEIIESDFAPATAPLSSDDQTSQDSLTNLPAVEPSLLAVPDNLIDDRPPEVARRAGNGSSGGGGSGDSGGSNGGSGASGSGGGSGDSGGSSGGGGSGDSGGSNGGSGASDSSGGSGDSGGSSDGGGKGKGKGKGGKGGKGGKNK